LGISLLDLQHSWTKNAFWDVYNKKCHKWCNFVSALLFNNTYGLPVRIINTKWPNQLFYVSLFDLQTICDKYWLETWPSPNNDIRICLLDMKHGWTKDAFWDLKNKECLKWCKFFYFTYLITLMAYLCSQWTPIAQIMNFMFNWSIYRLFVLNSSWKRDSK
jgi:hypothetical protein